MLINVKHSSLELTVDHDEIMFHVKHLSHVSHDELTRALQDLYTTHRAQYAADLKLSLPAHHRDDYEEHTTLKPFTPSAALSVTDLENEALKVVNAAELIAEPLSAFNLTRWGLRSLAGIVRALRKKAHS